MFIYNVPQHVGPQHILKSDRCSFLLLNVLSLVWRFPALRKKQIYVVFVIINLSR